MSNKVSQMKMGVILNYVNIIVGSLIPFFYTPVMLRLLGQNEYGLFKLSSTFTSYLALMAFGIGSAVSRYLVKARTEKGKEAEQKYLALFLIMFRIIAVLSLIVGSILVATVHIWYGNSLTTDEISTMRILVLIMVINTSLNFTMAPYISVVSSNKKFIFLQSMNIISTTLNPAVNIVILYCGYKSIGLAICSLVMNIIVRIIYYFYVRKSLKLKADYKEMPKDEVKEMMGFSFWVFLAQIVDMLYNSTDTVLIGAVKKLATVGVAIYNIGATFSSMVCNLASSMATIFMPQTNELVFSGASNKELTDYAIKIGRIQSYIMGLMVSGFAVFGKQFIQFYTGEGYEEAYGVALFTMVPMIIPMVQSICFTIVVAKNMHKFRSITYLCIAIVNVIGTWFAMKVWGITGAAMVTGVALIIGQGFVMNWYYIKKVGLEISRFWKNILPRFIIPAIMCLVGFVISKYVDFYNVVYMFVGIICYALIFCGLTWLFSFNEFEKNLVLSPIKRIQKNIN